jgi:hypothetical protein
VCRGLAPGAACWEEGREGWCCRGGVKHVGVEEFHKKRENDYATKKINIVQPLRGKTRERDMQEEIDRLKKPLKQGKLFIRFYSLNFRIHI